MLRQAIGTTGKTVAALAEEYRAALKKRIEEAEAENARK